MSLSDGVFCKKYIAGIKAHARAVTQSDVHAAGKRDHPAAPRRAVKIDDVRRKVVSKQQPGCRLRGVEERRLGVRGQWFKMGLSVSPAI